MSDYFKKDPNQSAGQQPGNNPWQQDPFAAYDDPAMNPLAAGGSPDDAGRDNPAYAPTTPKKPDYSAWRRPASMGFDAPAAGVDEAPAPGSALPEAYRPRPAAAPARPVPVDPALPEAYRPRNENAVNRPDFTARPVGFGGSQPAYEAGAEDADYGIVSADAAAPMPPYGGGFALPQQPVDGSFAAMGADAPTRIARPAISSQMVNKHKTVERGAGSLFAPREGTAPAMEAFQPAVPAAKPAEAPAAAPAQEDGAPRRRRVGRVARYEENVGTPVSAPEAPIVTEAAPRPVIAADFSAPAVSARPRFDPFEAGDSEAALPDGQAVQPQDEEPRPIRRPAVPGERYTGARTAMPQKGMPPRRDQVGVLHDEDEYTPADVRASMRDEAMEDVGAPDRRPVRPQDEQRPRPQGQPPQGQLPPVRLDENGRPVPPQGQRPPVRLDENGRPMPPQGQRPPVRLDENGRPIPPQAQRPPVRLDENGRPIPPQAQRPQGAPGGRPQPQPVQDEGFDPRRRMRMEEEGEPNNRFDPRRNYPEEQPRASVNRPRYDFEEDVEEEERPRRGGLLIPLLVVLLVVGGLLAGIMLPNWDNIGGGLGTAMGKIKSSVSGVFDSVKGLIMPEEEGVKSISVSPTTATAPVELVFNVQASTSVTDIRIVDQDGKELLSKTLTDSDMLGGDVTKNSKYNIWTLRYTCENAYSGVFTAQSKKKDGTWAAGMTLEQPVSIAPPVAAEPPVQDFETDTTQGTVPATVGFTVVTSTDVAGVQIVNDYGDVVAEAYLSDAGNQVVENEDTRTWTLTSAVADAYTGSFYAAYETEADLNFTQSDYSVDVALTAAEATPAADPNASSLGADTPDANLTADAGDTLATQTPTVEQTATAEATVAQTTTPAPEATPAPTPLPVLTVTADAAAAPSALKLSSKVYLESKLQTAYERTKKIVINEPFQYAVWEQSGVLTFRGDPFRQNAAFGTVDIKAKTLTEMWKVPVEGSIKAKSASLTGIGWPGQAIIVKWPTQLRAMLGLQDAAKNKQALKEAIIGAQNGKIYFIDLVTGEQTREPIAVDWPSNGAMSLQTNASPMLAVGQHIGVLAKKTLDNGLHLYNLINNKELTLLKGKDKLMQSNYSGFNGAPLFDKATGTMVVGGENGLLYTLEPGDEFDHILGSLKISPTIQKYSWLAGKQKAKNTNIDGAVAMYGSYAYFGDQSGIVQCVDVNTLAPMWAVDTGDNVDATVALDMENDTTVALYTGNTILNQGRSGVCTIRRLDALTGKQAWAFTVPDLVYTTEAEVGCEASPVVGRNKVSNLVFFTVTNGTKAATVYALDKATGAVQWTLPLSSPTLSSPVAVYNDAGDAWLVQAEGNGKLHLLDAATGAEVGSLQLEGSVEASPAVYRNVLVIGTTGGETSYIYGIKLE